MTKKQRLEQALRYRSAVYSNKRPLPISTVIFMQALRDALLQVVSPVELMR